MGSWRDEDRLTHDHQGAGRVVKSLIYWPFDVLVIGHDISAIFVEVAGDLNLHADAEVVLTGIFPIPVERRIVRLVLLPAEVNAAEAGNGSLGQVFRGIRGRSDARSCYSRRRAAASAASACGKCEQSRCTSQESVSARFHDQPHFNSFKESGNIFPDSYGEYIPLF